MMKLLDQFLSHISLLLVGTMLLVSPWLFGAWEMWWFWPFVLLLSLATTLLAVRLLLANLGGGHGHNTAPWLHTKPHMRTLLFCYAPFLFYALLRAWQADVAVDAERSFLLFFTPLLIALHIVHGFSRNQRRLLWTLILLDLCLLGLYGIINHEITGSSKVLWAPGYAEYTREQRASGPYFCPDHYAGILELGLGLAVGLLLSRGVRRQYKLAALLLAAIALWGILLSKSRGSGMTVLVMALSALVWGFWQWRPALRWALRGAALLVLLLLITVTAWLAGAYTERFLAYFGGEKLRTAGSLHEACLIATDNFQDYTRPRMYGAALRAWRTHRAFGIGPGMHQNLWPHFAATADGDRARGIWPSKLNNTFHSYEVHSDWLQLLEEYGLVGLALFLVPAVLVAALLLRALRSNALAWRAASAAEECSERHPVIMGALFAWVCMVFHSCGDFNLQMPATTWLFSAIVAVGLAETASVPRPTP